MPGVQKHEDDNRSESSVAVTNDALVSIARVIVWFDMEETRWKLTKKLTVTMNNHNGSGRSCGCIRCGRHQHHLEHVHLREFHLSPTFDGEGRPKLKCSRPESKQTFDFSGRDHEMPVAFRLHTCG